jgi:hypothetical protein
VCSSCVLGDVTDGFACSYGNRGNWSNGLKTFADPLPINSVIVGLSVILYGAFDCTDTSGERSQVTLELQKEEIATTELPQSLPCYCGNCATSFGLNVSVAQDWPGYRHGGLNTFRITVVGTNQVCLNKVELILEHIECM